MAQAFVTGGAGFIGSRLIARLVEDGHDVSALARSERSASGVKALGARAVSGDLTDPDHWRDAVAGADVVFHLAAETDAHAPWERHEQMTVVGTATMLEVARSAGVATFVLCSSESALLAGEPLVEVDETAPLQPDSPAAYCAAKARSEAEVLEAAVPGFTTVAIRPRFVWGPGSALVQGLADAAQSGQLGWIHGGRSTTDVTYVDNAVHGLVLGWQHGGSGQAYFVTDQHRVTMRDFLQRQLEILGVTRPVPELDDAAAADVPVPDRWFLGQECTLRTGKARDELGYTALVSHDEGFAILRDSVARAAD